jgi:putative transcriptional regulator
MERCVIRDRHWKLVSEWERGEKRPSGPSLKLLSIVKTRGLDAIA